MQIIEFDDGRIDSLEAVEAHVKNEKYPFIVVHDEKGITCNKYKVKAYPVGFLIGADRTVIWNGHPDPSMVQELEAKIEAALADAKRLSQVAQAGDPTLAPGAAAEDGQPNAADSRSKNPDDQADADDDEEEDE